MSQTYDVTAQIIAYESAELDDEQTIELFQHLLDTGMLWKLQGFYQRAAHGLLEAGLIAMPDRSVK